MPTPLLLVICPLAASFLDIKAFTLVSVQSQSVLAAKLVNPKKMKPLLQAEHRDRDTNFPSMQGDYKGIMVVVTPCRSDRSTLGLLPYSHLNDGRLHIILIRSCSVLQYLRFLASIPQTGTSLGGCFILNCICLGLPIRSHFEVNGRYLDHGLSYREGLIWRSFVRSVEASKYCRACSVRPFDLTFTYLIFMSDPVFVDAEKQGCLHVADFRMVAESAI